MKAITRITVCFIAVIMLLGTAMAHLRGIKILFTNESAAYLSNISNVNYIFSWCFLIAYLLVTFFAFRKADVIRLFILFILFGLWLLSGRVIAFKPFPDGRIITGYYYIETDRFNLCDNENDCESVISKEAFIQRRPFWLLKIKSKGIQKNIFLGPFTWQQCNKVFENRIKVTKKMGSTSVPLMHHKP